MKKIVAGMLAFSMLGLVGCSDNVKQTESLTFTDIKASNANMSAEEREDYIYSHITDRLTIDMAQLSKVNDTDVMAINSLLNDVHAELAGNEDKDVLGIGVTNYLLHAFARTPHIWNMSNVNILGYDSATRYYFVDVTYKTNPGAVKDSVPLSTIVMGEPNEEGKKKERYDDYTDYMNAATGGRAGASALHTKFVTKWGDIGTVVASQQDKLLSERVKKGFIGGVGYTGINKTTLAANAEMVVRYVIGHTYNVGEITGLEVDYVYLNNYKLENIDEVVNGLRGDTAGTEVVNSIIKDVITSYHRSVESNNLSGLYGLFVDFRNWDKYYNDLNRYSYHTYLGFDYEILGSKDGNIDVLVTRGRKERGKGSSMSSPVYTEKVIFRLQVSNNDTIKILEEVLLSRDLIGEPNTVVRNVAGVSNKMLFSSELFTEENQRAVEQTIKDFSDAYVNSDSNNLRYMSYVDVAINQNVLNNMIAALNSFSNVNEKLTWVVGYENKTNLYCSVKVREVYKTNEGNYDTETIIDLSNTNGTWGIVGYYRGMSVKLANGVAVDETGVLHKSVKGA